MLVPGTEYTSASAVAVASNKNDGATLVMRVAGERASVASSQTPHHGGADRCETMLRQHDKQFFFY
jgi:hypothetical protein